MEKETITKSICQDCGRQFGYIYLKHKRMFCNICLKRHKKESNKKYFNKPEIKEKQKTYYNRSEAKEKSKKYNNRPEVKNRHKKHCKKYYNKPETKKKMKEYENKPEIKEHRKKYNNKYKKERYKKDPKFKLNCIMRSHIYSSLKGNKNGRGWKNLVGYSLLDLKKHIEKQFTENMNWELFLKGEIQIDHKIPISVFNFTKPEHEDFKKCWALKNLQPLWAEDNLKKGVKLYGHFQPSLKIEI